jgi:hypothetical protein
MLQSCYNRHAIQDGGGGVEMSEWKGDERRKVVVKLWIRQQQLDDDRWSKLMCTVREDYFGYQDSFDVAQSETVYV